MTSANDLCRAIDEDRTSMQTLLSALVAIPSENPPGNEYAACLNALESAAEALGLEHERIELAEDPPRIALSAWIGRGGPAIHFHGHYDVVPASRPEQFMPRVEGDTLFGRGSSDMKSGLVSMLFAARAFRKTGMDLDGRVSLMFVPDEETGGAAGSARLASAGILGRDGIGMLLPEPTSGRIWNASRGAISLMLTVRGRAAHVGLQQHGLNAVERSVPILDRLFELKRELDERGSILLVGGRVEAGTNFNVVPDLCRFSVDRRTNPDEDFELERKRLFDLIESAGRGAELSIDVIQEGRSSSTAEDERLGRILTSAIEEIVGEAAVMEMCPGLLETRFYAARGVPSYAYGPGILAVSHGPTEFVRMTKMFECAKIYALTAARMLGAA
jgi:succinyl-diaminopimelate desuccinylase